MDTKQVKILVGKYLKGECSAEEQTQLFMWWEDMVANGEISRYLSKTEQLKVQEHMWTSIQQGIATHAASARPAQRVRVMIPRAAAIVGIAASLLLLAVFVITNPFSREVVVRTSFGEMREVTLPDHSLVVLHGNSSIRFARTWDDTAQRTLWLDGEAYFQVTHTETHSQFVVHTPGDLTITVLGTKFNVNNRSQLTEVVLDEGRVRLDHKNTSYTMSPQEMVTYTQKNATFVSNLTRVRERVSWKDHVLIFKDEPLGAIAEKLKDRYGVTIVFENEDWESDPFTGSIPTDSVLVFLDKVKNLYKAEVIYKNGVYVVR